MRALAVEDELVEHEPLPLAEPPGRIGRLDVAREGTAGGA
jgi:hypothetical protein